MSKYYYQRGMCEALHYVSLNPILYEKLKKIHTQNYKWIVLVSKKANAIKVKHVNCL